MHDVAERAQAHRVLSEHERRRFDLIVGELARDDDVSRRDARRRVKARSRKIHGGRRRGPVQWAGQRFGVWLRRDRGW